MVKKSGRYLLLFESNKEFKIGSYFRITLYVCINQAVDVYEIDISRTKELNEFRP